MKLEIGGFRKFGMAGITAWALLAFIVFDVVGAPVERIWCIAGAIGMTALYIIGNIIQNKLLNNGGENNANGNTGVIDASVLNRDSGGG